MTASSPYITATVRGVIAGMLILGGSFIWSHRLDFSLEPAFQAAKASSVSLIDPAVTSDLTSACNFAERKEGWMLFIATASLTSDDMTRGFFQTALDEQGLFMDFNPQDGYLLRVGVTSDGTTRYIPLRTVRVNEEVSFVIAVRSGMMRAITSGVDKLISWPESKVEQLRCDAVRTDMSDEVACGDCNVTLRYFAGSGNSELDDILDAVSNRRAYEVKRWLGNGLIALGLLSLVIRRARFGLG